MIVKAGKNAGCRTAYVGRYEEIEVGSDVIAESLIEFVNKYLVNNMGMD
jgi:cystathionine beta-lyase family protein involved in aluminum resistance